MPVLVDVAEALQRPKRRDIKRKIDSTRIWLQTADLFLNVVPDACKFPLCCILPIVMAVYHRKFVVAPRFLPIAKNQLPDKVIERRSQIIENLSYTDGPFDRRVGRGAAVHPRLFPCLAISFVNDQTFYLHAECAHVGVERLDLGLCACNLRCDAREISHEPDLDKLETSNNRGI